MSENLQKQSSPQQQSNIQNEKQGEKEPLKKKEIAPNKTYQMRFDGKDRLC